MVVSTDVFLRRPEKHLFIPPFVLKMASAVPPCRRTLGAARGVDLAPSRRLLAQSAKRRRGLPRQTGSGQVWISVQSRKAHSFRCQPRRGPAYLTSRPRRVSVRSRILAPRRVSLRGGEGGDGKNRFKHPSWFGRGGRGGMGLGTDHEAVTSCKRPRVGGWRVGSGSLKRSRLSEFCHDPSLSSRTSVVQATSTRSSSRFSSKTKGTGCGADRWEKKNHVAAIKNH